MILNKTHSEEKITQQKEYDDNIKMMYFFIIYVQGLINGRMEG